MKKFFYPIVVLTLVILLGFVYKNYEKKKNAIPELKERPLSINMTSEWLNTKQAIDGLLDKIRRNPKDIKSKLQLAMAYVQESRVTGDHAYYDESALKLVDQVLAKEPQNYDALCVKTTILLSQHHFADALKEALSITQQYPEAAYGYGLLCDAYVELGDYEKANEAADKMMSIRPDMRSYSRMAYLYEIHGDYEGAKKTMALAVRSGVPGLEQTEWCRVQLGKLYENTGDTAKAAFHYQMALAARPDYAYALAGLGRLAKINKAYTEGVAYLEKANMSVMDFSFNEELIDMYRFQNQQVKSLQTAQKVIQQLAQHANTDEAEPDKGHYADMELAYAYLAINDVEKALTHVTREWNRRPENIDINECMAWVYFQKNDAPNAVKYIQKALKTDSQKPILLWRAGQIFLKNNENDKGNSLINKALSINKYFQV
jgi:tetratricopeptide (TPR) repeat protein